MQFTSKPFFFPILTFCCAFGILFFFYHAVLLHPNDFLFAPGGDGIQNYYTYLFHARYDTEFWNFSGMNYPFGEHAVYAGSQPVLSWLIGAMGLEPYGVGILNFLMLLSYPLCAFFLFKIFRHYKLPDAVALIAALAIAFLSPQVFRMTGHLSLSGVFVIPLMWWLLILANKSRPVFWSFVIAVYVLWIFFTHPYLGLILLFFGFFFQVANLVAFREKWKPILLKILVQIVLPFCIFQLLVLSSDTHVDRLGTPAGFFDYYANWKSLFVAHHGPMSYFTVWFDINIGNWESWNYVGLATAIFSLTILVYVIRSRKTFPFKKYLRDELVLFFIAAYFILLFSFCFPLKYEVFRGLADYLGPLKQFRVLGRFTWIFFYVFTVFSIIGFYRVMQKKGNPGWMKALFFGGLAFYFVELYPAQKSTSLVVKEAPNTFKRENLKPDYEELVSFIESEKYDAFIFLPMTHLSSENIMLLGTEEANFDSYMLSYHTGKPMMNAVASRMSLSETILINNFFSPEFIEKELVYKFDKNAKIAIVTNREGVKRTELPLLWISEKVYENGRFDVFHFDAEKWNTPYYFDEVVRKEKRAVNEVGQGWKSDTNSVWFYYESFDNTKGESLGGEGALHDVKNGYNTILELDKTKIEPGLYTVSFWYYLGVDRADVSAVAEQVFTGGKPSYWYDIYGVSQSTLIVENWCHVSLKFEFTADMEKINILITGNGNRQPFYVDELLVQKQGDHNLFTRKKKGRNEYIIYNNYWINASSFQRNE